MKHYKKPDGSIWAFEPDGSQDDLITADMTPISDADLAALRAPTHLDLVAQALAETRAQRQPIISVLDGLQASALVKADAATATEIETAKQALRDITKVDLSACVTYDDMKAAMLAAYRAIAAAAPASVQLAFAGALQ